MTRAQACLGLVALLVGSAVACGGNQAAPRKVDAGTPDAGDGDASSRGTCDGGACKAPDETPDAAPPRDAAVESAADAPPDVGTDAAPDAAAVRRALSVAIGDEHACVLLDDGTVKCWGHFVTDTDHALPRAARAIAAGGPNTCAILDDGSVTCWAPGLGGTTPGVFMSSFGAGRRAVQLAMAGRQFMCALMNDDTVECWNSSWHIGTAPELEHLTPPTGAARIAQLIQIFGSELIPLYADGTVGVSLRLTLGPPRLLENQTAKMITGARGSVWSWCAILVRGGLHCEGTSQSALPTAPPTQLSALAQGDNFLCGLRSNGTVTCWGNLSGCDDVFPATSYWCKPGRTADGGHDVDLGKRAVAITSGTLLSTACALLEDGSVKCWGGNGAACQPSGSNALFCEPPAQQHEIIGKSVEIKQTSTGRAYGAWRAIDLDAPP